MILSLEINGGGSGIDNMVHILACEVGISHLPDNIIIHSFNY